MSLESEMRAILVADNAVAAVVSTRIYPWQRAEDSALPAIVYRSIDEDPRQTLNSGVRLSETTVEYECIAETVAAVLALAELVRQSLAGLTTLATITPVAIRHTGTRNSFIDPFDGSSSGLYASIVEFTVMHRTPSLS